MQFAQSKVQKRLTTEAKEGLKDPHFLLCHSRLKGLFYREIKKKIAAFYVTVLGQQDSLLTLSACHLHDIAHR